MTLLHDARRAWRIARLERAQERQRQEWLRARQKQIAAYFTPPAASRMLHIGAGTNLLEGWLNTDFEPASAGVAFVDALETFPFDDRVFDCVFSEHMIEHIPYKGGLFMLSEASRVLKPGGRLRIATPDLRKITGLLSDGKSDDQKRYIEWSASEVIGLYSEQPSPLQLDKPEWAIDPAHIRRFYPDACQDSVGFVVNNFFRSWGHQFLYDDKTLTAAMLQTGFVDVARREPGQSVDKRLSGIESHGRVIGEANNAIETMVLEGVRA
jgi:SAM-dependent methyltransferase